MRRFLTCLFVAVLYTANAFAASATISRTIPTKNVTENTTERVENTTVKNRSAREVAAPSRGVGQNVSTTSQKTTKVVSRSVNNRQNKQRATLSDGVNVVGRNARTESASINSNPALRRAGVTLRASTAEVGGRATIGNTNIQTGSNIDEQVRSVQTRASSIFGSQKKQQTVTAESLAAAKDIMEKTSDLNSTCQQQYNECMDQFCAVVDTNQKRCSCSANLAKYAKAQQAVEDANTELNDVAQRIRYVGLSADEIRAIMSATEAELEMDKTKDNTQTRSLLEDIAEMIKDPTSSTTLTGSTTVDSLLDMDFDFSSDSSDLFSLDLFTSSGSDLSSKRGKALYNEAKKRCKTVLNRCKDAGGTEDQISGNYDLAIDKDCLAYEQGLEKLNDTLKNNVRSANLMLQKARLAVLQNKNQYDIKGCVAALENCMLDDMVCGENYVKCVDPTKMFIDENGKVVLGRNIANITNFMTEYNNTNITTDFIKNSSKDTTCSNHDGACIVNYLMTKIGTGATAKDGGLCRAVLDKCQAYTYTQSGKTSKYDPYNEVIVNYIQRAMVNIKAAQAKIISDYASTCMNDISDCYNQQNTQITSWSSSASVDNVYSIMKGACYNIALTCAYGVFAYDVKMGDQTCQALFNNCTSGCTCEGSECSCNGETKDLNNLTPQQKYNQENVLIEGISEIFAQSLLCPVNSTFDSNGPDEGVTAGVNRTVEGWVNNRCKCNAGYSVWNGGCSVTCASDQYRNNSGLCTSTCSNGYVPGGEEDTNKKEYRGCVPSDNNGGSDGEGGDSQLGGNSGGGSSGGPIEQNVPEDMGLGCDQDNYSSGDSCYPCPENSHSGGGFVNTCDCNEGYTSNDETGSGLVCSQN